MDFWNSQKEQMSRNQIEQLQLERLQASLNRVYKNVSHYRNTFLEMDFMPEDLNSLKDLKKLPFTTRKHLMDNYPYGMFAVPLREVVRLHTSSLSFDNPVVMGFTKNDLANWANLMARNLVAVGVDKDDVVQISLTYGMITGPFGVQLGAELIGASVIPISSGKLSSQVKVMKDFKTTTLVSTPTFALGLLESIRKLKINPNSLSLKRGIFGSEPWSENTRHEIESGLQITATDTYGLTEIFGPGVAWECLHKDGLHIPEDYFIPEIIDPITCKPVPNGTEGELVLTTLLKEAFPLIRFRTGDIAKINYEKCSCGRSYCRISRIVRRCDNVVVIRETSILPSQIGKIIMQMANADKEINYQLIVERKNGQDFLIILVEMSDQIFFDEMRKQRIFVENLHKNICEFLGWEVEVKLVESQAFDIEKKVIDRRNFS